MSHDQADRLRLIARGQATFQGRVLRQRHARTIAIASGKGGVGKTNLAVNLGLALAKHGAAVTVVDLDLGLANIDVILGLKAPLTLHQVLTGECTIDQALTEGPFGMRVVCGGSGIAALARLSERRRAQLVEMLSVIDRTSDIVLLDVGAGIAPAVLDFIAAAGEAIVVTTTEPPAMTDAYALIKVVSQQARGTAFRLVVNQVTNAREAEDVAVTMIGVARRFLGVTVTNLAYLPRDERLRAAVKQQVPVLVAYPTCQLSASIEQLAARLHPYGVPAPARPVNTFSRFLHRLTGKVA
jgi:flagellar biosynthesis protein FlhG